MRDWLDCKLMLSELLRNVPILSHIFHTLFYIGDRARKKIIQWKAVFKL